MAAAWFAKATSASQPSSDLGSRRAEVEEQVQSAGGKTTRALGSQARDHLADARRTAFEAAQKELQEKEVTMCAGTKLAELFLGANLLPTSMTLMTEHAALIIREHDDWCSRVKRTCSGELAFLVSLF